MENIGYYIVGGLLVLFGLVVYFWSRRAAKVTGASEIESKTRVCLVQQAGFFYLCRYPDGSFVYSDGAFGKYRVDLVYRGTSKRKSYLFAEKHGWIIVTAPSSFHPLWM